jgi:hypothetical protein
MFLRIIDDYLHTVLNGLATTFSFTKRCSLIQTVESPARLRQPNYSEGLPLFGSI